jgi:lipoprotein-anchoring transpeptidase ErfK/SrfK
MTAATPQDNTFGLAVTQWEPQAPRRRRWRWWVLGVLLVLLAVAGTATAVLANGAIRLAEELDGRLLPDTTIGAVAVGGLTPADALAAVQAEVDPTLDREITLAWGEHRWVVTPRELGSSSDAEAVVAAAADVTATLDWEALARMRWLDEAPRVERDVTIIHDPEGAAAFVAGLAAEVDRDPRDAALSTDGGWVEIAHHRIGYALDVEASADALAAAVADGGDVVDLTVQRLEPEVLADAYRQVLLVRQHERKLYLYNDGEITHSWNVAVGAAGYPTPTGVFSLTQKRYLPTWINPAPNGWGADMPAQIGPGRDNPLGLRALNWSVGAIRFHGTENLRSIGTAASKGCVRLSNSDVVGLYDLVDEGATIVSVRA